MVADALEPSDGLARAAGDVDQHADAVGGQCPVHGVPEEEHPGSAAAYTHGDVNGCLQVRGDGCILDAGRAALQSGNQEFGTLPGKALLEDGASAIGVIHAQASRLFPHGDVIAFGLECDGADFDIGVAADVTQHGFGDVIERAAVSQSLREQLQLGGCPLPDLDLAFDLTGQLIALGRALHLAEDPDDLQRGREDDHQLDGQEFRLRALACERGRHADHHGAGQGAQDGRGQAAPDDCDQGRDQEAAQEGDSCVGTGDAAFDECAAESAQGNEIEREQAQLHAGVLRLRREEEAEGKRDEECAERAQDPGMIRGHADPQPDGDRGDAEDAHTGYRLPDLYRHVHLEGSLGPHPCQAGTRTPIGAGELTALGLSAGDFGYNAPMSGPAMEPSGHRDAVFGLAEHDGRLLLVLNPRVSRGELQDWWDLPGGAVRPGEPLDQALEREWREETTLSVEVEDLLFVVDGAKRHDGGGPALHLARVRVLCACPR